MPIALSRDAQLAVTTNSSRDLMAEKFRHQISDSLEAYTTLFSIFLIPNF